MHINQTQMFPFLNNFISEFAPANLFIYDTNIMEINLYKLRSLISTKYFLTKNEWRYLDIALRASINLSA